MKEQSLHLDLGLKSFYKQMHNVGPLKKICQTWFDLLLSKFEKIYTWIQLNFKT